MIVKKFGVLLLLSQFSFASTQQSEDATQTTAPVSAEPAYQSPSVEMIQADKEFCLSTLRNSEDSIDGLSPSGKTSLQLLTLYFINNFDTRQLMQLALKRGANANIVDEHGRTPLFFVVAYTLCPEVFEEKQKTLDEAAAATETTPALQTTEVPLDTAAKSATHSEKNGAEEAALPTKQIRSPLHDKAISMEVVEMFLAYQADPTHTDHQGISPLLLAITMGNQEMIDLFARYGLLEKLFQNQEEAEQSNPTLCDVTNPGMDLSDTTESENETPILS